jgi:hypothetical protein
MQALPSASVIVDWVARTGDTSIKNSNTDIKKWDVMTIPPDLKDYDCFLWWNTIESITKYACSVKVIFTSVRINQRKMVWRNWSFLLAVLNLYVICC